MKSRYFPRAKKTRKTRKAKEAKVKISVNAWVLTGDTATRIYTVFSIYHDTEMACYTGRFYNPLTLSQCQCYALRNNGPFYTWQEWLEYLKQNSETQYHALLAVIKNRNEQEKEGKS